MFRFIHLALLAACLSLTLLPHSSHAEGSEIAELRRRSDRSNDLTWLRGVLIEHPWLAGQLDRDALIAAKYRSLAERNLSAAARVNGLLAAEAQIRADLVLSRWLEQLDHETGLLPKGHGSREQVWDYADTGADLFPHLVIAASLLRPEQALPLVQMIVSERRINGSASLPSNIDLTSNQPIKQDLEDRMYGSVEYAKDGLLPLLERLGSGPWSDRLVEITHSMIDADAVATRFGSIPSESSEVNGQALQVLSRMTWLTGDKQFAAAGLRLTQSYLDLALPNTEMIPGRTWDFGRERANTRQVQLRDHGNEIVAGLIEFHLLESQQASVSTTEHRQQIRAMLNVLLDRGRTAEGLWKSSIDFQTGAALKDTLSDNWGYLFAAYLTQAMIEERLPGGDRALAAHYREAVDRGLAAAADLELYPWQGSEPDGYADTIESALYVLGHVDSLKASRWVDRQAGTLFGAQLEHGLVEDRYLDGNFVRTALLYAAWQSQGVRVEPWQPSTMLGAVRDGDCLRLALSAGVDWSGRVMFDSARHRTHLTLPFDYPRLNAWPEWFSVDERATYQVTNLGSGAVTSHGGAELLRGIPVSLSSGADQDWRLCRVASQ